MQIILLLSLLSLIFILFSVGLEIYMFNNAPFLKNQEFKKPLDTSISIIIPAFNEEKNIVRCLKALSSIKKPCPKIEIIVVDDLSDDNTISIAENFKEDFMKNSIGMKVISAGQRPKDKNWVGKNWACYVGTKNIDSEWLLFLDADVEVSEKCIFNALSKSQKDNIDLLSLAPKVNCNCLAEWIVQPIMTSLLIIGFPISDTNNPKSSTAFAAGPFMLFKAKSYFKIGGHEGTFNKVVEDLALAEKIKGSKLKLNFLIAIKDVSLNMYSDLSSLIEGWSKNWFLGVDKNIFKSLSASIFVLITNTIPWLIIIFCTTCYLLNIRFLVVNITFLISALAIASYGIKRYWLRIKYNIPNDLWYLNGIGGLIVTYISFLSIYKTFTGIGWTWKGRKLNK